jgi:hypothetical protein
MNKDEVVEVGNGGARMRLTGVCAEKNTTATVAVAHLAL